MPPKKKTQQLEIPEQEDWSSETEVKEQKTDLHSVLENIQAREGVVGYILRAATSASVDIKDPSKIVDYAVISTSSLEFAENLSQAFGLGKVRNIIVEGKDLKVLLLTIGEQRVSVFMNKNVDHDSILKELS